MSESFPRCLTRVVDGSGQDLQLAQVHAVMQRIVDALSAIPANQRAYVGIALLNQAVNRILAEEGSPHAVALLLRLRDAVQSKSALHGPDQAVDLTVLHG